MPSHDSSNVRDQRCSTSRTNSRGVSDAEIVRQRLFKPRPFQAMSTIGNAEACISEPRNTEKMFSFYSDLAESPPHHQSTSLTPEPSQKSLRSPSPRWSTGPINPLWGNVVQMKSTPKSWSQLRSDCLDPTLDSSTLLRSSRLSPSRSVEIGTESMDLSSSRGNSIRSKDWERPDSAVSSLSVNDRSNLSPAMLRALHALKLENASRDDTDDRRKKESDNDSSSSSTTKQLSSAEQSQSSHAPRQPSASTASDHFVSSTSSSRSRSPQHSSMSESLLSSQVQSNLLATLTSPHRSPLTPSSLEGEFIYMKDTLDPSGGIKVGFGGLSRLREHVSQGWVNHATVLALEFEFCTHGYDCVSAGDILKSKYYRHYMTVCDAIESSLSTSWNICFLIKRGKPRRGSFELQAMWLVGSVEYSLTLASKLCTSKFPSAKLLSQRICNALEGSNPPSSSSGSNGCSASVASASEHGQEISRAN